MAAMTGQKAMVGSRLRSLSSQSMGVARLQAPSRSGKAALIALGAAGAPPPFAPGARPGRWRGRGGAEDKEGDVVEGEREARAEQRKDRPVSAAKTVVRDGKERQIDHDE